MLVTEIVNNSCLTKFSLLNQLFQPLLSPSSPVQEITESYWSIFQTVWVEAVCLVATFTITIAVFPTLVSTFEPSDDIVTPKYFLPIFCFLNFNIFGKILALKISPRDFTL